MKRTVANALDWLERPENNGQIQYLAYLRYLPNLKIEKRLNIMENLMLGVFMRVIKTNADAILVLSHCKTTADIAVFKQTPHYKKIKDIDIGGLWDGYDLSRMAELEGLS